MVFPARVIPRGYAATTGLVCIASISDVVGGKCPTAAPSFNGPLTTPNTLLRVPVMINDTDTFNGFDITINSTRDSAGHSVLKPYGVDLTGSVMPANSIPLVECAGTISIIGNSCAVNATIDNPTSVRAAVIFSSFLTIGTTGLLFTAIFSINGTAAIGGVTIGFQNHCGPFPSVSSIGHLCISISNGSTGAVPENVQTGGFDNSDTTTLPYATLSTTISNLGESLAGSPTHSLPTAMYTITSQNGFETSTAPQLALAVSFNGTGLPHPTAALNMSSLDLTGLSAHPFTQTSSLGSNVPAGLYIATVTATYQTADLITFTTDSLSAAYSLSFNVTDFILTTSVSTISIQPPGSQQITVTVAPKAGFNTPVSLGLILPLATLSAGIGASFSTQTIQGGTGTSILTITTTPTTPHGTFQLTITGNSTLNGFSRNHIAVISVATVRPDFTISANPTTIVFPSASPTSTLTLTSFNFTGTVQVGVIFDQPSPGLVVTIVPYLVVLRQNGQNFTTISLSQSSTSVPAGTYILTFTGTSGSLVHSLNVTVVVSNSPPPDFTISANPSFLMLASGSSTGTSSIMVSSLNGLSGNIQLSASSLTGFPGGTLALSLNPSQLSLTSGSSASSLLTVTASNLAAGTYFVNVTGTYLSTMHSVLVTVQVPAPPDFQLFVNTNLSGNTILAGTTTFFGVQVNSVGPALFNSNITLTGRAFPVLPNGPVVSLNPSQVILSPNQQYGFSTLTISTTALTPPGNYTITIQGASGNIVHNAQFRLTVLPPPILTVSPTKGPVGTQVTVHGSGFVPSQQGFFNPVQVEMTFDDQLVGLFFLQSSSFNFTFNVPVSQVGIVHTIHARVLFFFPMLDVQANFLVVPEPNSLTVNINSGTIYFPGDTATIFAMTTLNGQPTTITSLQIIMVRPNGSNITLNTVIISPGVYRATFAVPTTGPIGTYAIVAKAHLTGSTDASALVSFEVQPTWLSSNGHNIVTATTIAGVVGVLGLMGLAWRRGYFSRRRDEFFSP